MTSKSPFAALLRMFSQSPNIQQSQEAGRPLSKLEALSRFVVGFARSSLISIVLFYIILCPLVDKPLYDLMLFHPDRSDYSASIGSCNAQLKRELNVDAHAVTFHRLQTASDFPGCIL